MRWRSKCERRGRPFDQRCLPEEQFQVCAKQFQLISHGYDADDDATIGTGNDNSDSDGDSHRSNSGSQVDLGSVGQSAGV